MTKGGGDRDRDLVVDRIYEVALEPSSLEGFIDFWHDNQLAEKMADGDQSFVFDENYKSHLDRAQTILHRDYASRPDLIEHLKPYENLAAFVVSDSLRVEALNSGAYSAFGFQIGEDLKQTAMPFEVRDALIAAAKEVLGKTGAQEKLLKTDLATKSGTILFRVTRLDIAGGYCALALVVSTLFHWREAIGSILQDVFHLTNAEMDVVRLLVDGQDIKMISEARSTSIGTVRSQVKSITGKMNLRSQTDIVRMVMTLGKLPEGSLEADDKNSMPKLSKNWLDAEVWKPFRSMTLPDGRKLTYHDMGPVTGDPVLLTHMGSCMVRWPRNMVKMAFEQNLRIICPIRAGYGQSDNLAPDADPITTATEDTATLLTSLGIFRLPMAAQGTDFPLAANMIAKHSNMISALIGLGARPNLPCGEYIVGTGRWQRFFVSTARNAPGLLEFASKAVMAMSKRIGPEAMLRQLCKDSRSDLALLEDDVVRAVLEANLSLMAGKDTNAARAFAKEFIAFQIDRSIEIAATRSVPVQIFLGDEDPTFDLNAIPALQAAYPWMSFEVLPNAGLALMYQAPRRLVAEMAKAARLALGVTDTSPPSRRESGL
jgi:pimeloyl-ACP methyl ester carboxylesterase/DNA-binding CsgD family transcriptional regulator